MATARKIKFRTREKDGGVEVVAQISPHPMDPKTKQKIPAHFIREVTLEHNGKVVATMLSSGAVSADPLLRFRLKNAKKGDKVKLSWSDNKGESGSGETTVDF
jgi:sulfur-oxidizing protein SoxZ